MSVKEALDRHFHLEIMNTVPLQRITRVDITLKSDSVQQNRENLKVYLP